MSNKLAKMSSLQRDNLLINSDFRSGIINQKGLSEYNPTSKEYTIDMWYTYAGIVSVLDGYIKVTKNSYMSGNATFTQLFSYLSNEKCTIAIKTKSLNGIAKIHIGSLGVFDLSANKINIFTINGSFNVICFELSGYIELEYVKLEKGSNFTGMPVWDYSNEFEKCWKHFRVYKGNANDVIAITVSDKNGTFTLPFDVKNMVKKPKVTKNGVWTVSGDVYAEANVHSVCANSVIFISTIKETIIQVYFNSNNSYIYIDAYDY